jgi:hypothetical protein
MAPGFLWCEELLRTYFTSNFPLTRREVDRLGRIAVAHLFDCLGYRCHVSSRRVARLGSFVLGQFLGQLRDLGRGKLFDPWHSLRHVEPEHCGFVGDMLRSSSPPKTNCLPFIFRRASRFTSTRDFVDAIRTNRNPLVPVQPARMATDLVYQIYCNNQNPSFRTPYQSEA